MNQSEKHKPQAKDKEKRNKHTKKCLLNSIQLELLCERD